MLVGERAPTIQRPEVDQELRIRTDTTTWLAETLHGSMRTSFEFTFDGQELRGEDGGSLDEVFDDAVAEAHEMTKLNPSLLFELRRRLIERDELEDMYKMARGELPNTMIVISDFPPELQRADKDVGGYNVSRQQTMMRIITREDDGKLRVVSQSLDHSDREALEAVYGSLGEPVQEGELLGQRVHRNMSTDHQEKLADSLTQEYDDSLTERRGGEWHAGISQRPDRNIVNTYEFALAQRDLIDWFVTEKRSNSTQAEKLRYKLAATVSARHMRHLSELNRSATVPGNVHYDSVVTVRGLVQNMQLMQEIDREGRRATAQGKVFSGCGGTVEAEQEDEFSSENQLAKLGYGNKAFGSSDQYGSRKFKCPDGHENTRPYNKLIDKCQHAGCNAKVKC